MLLYRLLNRPHNPSSGDFQEQLFKIVRSLGANISLIQGDDTIERGDETASAIVLQRATRTFPHVHIPKGEMVLASKTIMELDATCDKRVGALLEGIGRTILPKPTLKPKSRHSLLMNFEQKCKSDPGSIVILREEKTHAR